MRGSTLLFSPWVPDLAAGPLPWDPPYIFSRAFGFPLEKPKAMSILLDNRISVRHKTLFKI